MKWLLKLLPIQFKIWLYKLLYKDIADKGEAEDTELAHINKFEAQLLKRVGGLGKKNPVTGLRGFLGGGGSGGGGQGNSGQPGTSNRGVGGGGKWGYPSGSKGSGGSGIVIIKYKYQ